MIVSVARSALIKQESSCLLREGEQLMVYPYTGGTNTAHQGHTAYQAGHCWTQIIILAPDLPCLREQGWKPRLMGLGNMLDNPTYNSQVA